MSQAGDDENVAKSGPVDKVVQSPCICGISSYALGSVSLILVVFGWVATNFLTSQILSKYDKPFLMTCLNMITFQFYFLFFFTGGDPLNKWLQKRNASPPAEKACSRSGSNASTVPSASSNTSTNLSLDTTMHSILPKVLPPKIDSSTDAEKATVFSDSEQLSLFEIAKIGIIFFPLILASNYFTNVAFGTTSVGSASILASTCGFFTLLFGRLVGVDRLSLLRILAVLVSVGGVLLISRAEFSDPGNTALGNAFSLVGAALYGVYSTFLKKAVKNESQLSMTSLFAIAGLYTLLFTWPVILGLHFSGIEEFEMPPDWTTVGFILVNMICGALIPNYLWNVAFALTSPLMVAVGIGANIPLTLVGEYLLYGQRPPLYKVLSAACIVVGFGIVNFADLYPRYDIDSFGKICSKSKNGNT